MEKQQSSATYTGNNLGIASLVAGIIALCSALTGPGSLLGIVCGILGIIFGAKARRLLPPGERTMATAGWICSIIALSICAALFIILCGFLGLFFGFMP